MWIFRKGKAFILPHQLSGHLIKLRDVHFDEGEFIEPSRVQIETEVVKNTGKVDVLLDQEIDSSTALSEGCSKSQDGDSNKEDNKKKLDELLEGDEPTEEPSSYTKSSLTLKNSQKHPNM